MNVFFKKKITKPLPNEHILVVYWQQMLLQRYWQTKRKQQLHVHLNKEKLEFFFIFFQIKTVFLKYKTYLKNVLKVFFVIENPLKKIE